MEVEIQSEQVVEHVSGNFANCLLRDTGKDCIAQLLEESGSNAGCAIYRVQLGSFHQAEMEEIAYML
jgi:5-methylthioribose kinase